MIKRYALVKGNKYYPDGLSEFTGDVSQFTSNIDRAKLYTLRYLKTDYIAELMSNHGIDFVKVEIERRVASHVKSSQKLKQKKLAKMQEAFDLLDTQDVDSMSDQEWKQYRRLRTMLRNNCVYREDF